MAFNFRMQLFVAVLFFSVLSQVTGHSYMTSPTSRSNQAQSNTGCRGPSCLGPCDIPLSQATRAPIAAARGDPIVVDWPRNNHAGGFIRFAWAPTSQSDSHAAFDNHVQQINCHEIGDNTPGHCAPADPINDPNGGGSGPGDGSSGACTTNITVPLDLIDGKWTLQWAWFGGAFSLGDYYSCTDFVISGGSVGVLTPVFKGGDFSYPNQQKCKFFNTDKLHVCVNEPCNAPIYAASQQQSGPPAAGQLGAGIPIQNGNGQQSPSPSSPSTPVPSQPSTTGRIQPQPQPQPPAQPVTTGRVQPQPQPQQPQQPVSTGAIVHPTPSPPSPSPMPSNCASATSVSTSTATMVSIDSWGTQFHGVIMIDVNEAVLSNWVLEIVWPSSATSTHVIRYFNAGALQCEGTLTSFFGPVASWANNAAGGSQLQVEFIATNTNGMDPNYIMANTQLRVLIH